jgi:hypothetical protein
MELEFRPDFEAVRADWDTFTAGTPGRPFVNIVIPRAGMTPQPAPRSYEMTFGDIDTLIDRVLAWAQSHEFMGDAIPFFRVSFASDHFSALLGADIKYHPQSPDTMWVEPFVEDWDAVDIRLQREGHWWQRTLEAIGRFRERCDGKLITAACHLQGNLDCLSALRGPQNLLLDLIECPDKVHRTLRAVDAALAETRAALDEAFDVAQFGSMDRHGTYCRGSLDIPQCDFSAMIGPDMFDEFVLPSLQHECDILDSVTYHLDGPDALRHVESLCRIENLHLIQWVAGAGEAQRQDWDWLYRRIAGLGKGLVLFAAPERIAPLWEICAPHRMQVNVSLGNRDAALRLIDEVRATAS